MERIDNHLWSKCFAGVAKESAFHQSMQQGNSNFYSQWTCDDLHFRSCSSINVPNATEQDTINASATVPVQSQQMVLHPQLQEVTFKPVTPIRYKVLNSLLQEHPNREKVEYVVRGFQFGFSLKYKGPLKNRQPKNLLSAYQHPGKLWVSLMKEVYLG